MTTAEEWMQLEARDTISFPTMDLVAPWARGRAFRLSLLLDVPAATVPVAGGAREELSAEPGRRKVRFTSDGEVPDAELAFGP